MPYNHLGTHPSGLYREVVLLQGGLFRQVSLYMQDHASGVHVDCTCVHVHVHMYIVLYTIAAKSRSMWMKVFSLTLFSFSFFRKLQRRSRVYGNVLGYC